VNGDQEHVQRRYLFHAEALGVAAHFRRPKDFFLDSVAGSCLAITGGRAEAQAGPGGAGGISYRSAYTRIVGDYDPPVEAARYTYGNYTENNLPARTFVEVKVSGFKIDVPQEDERRAPGLSRRTLVIDDMDLTMETFSERGRPNAFRTLTASIRGVTVDGRKLIVETNTQIFTDKFSQRKLQCALDDEDFRLRSSNQIFYHDSNGALCTVVSGLRWADSPPDFTTLDSNRLAIQGLGSLYFGELIIQEGLRRLTLVRFQLGSPEGGEGAAGQGSSNGVGVPPMING
jgi:hypothetical protein